MGDEEREALVEALTTALGEHYDGSSRDWLADALLPVVDAIARRRAAEELRAAADEPDMDDVFGGRSVSVSELRARADALEEK